MAVSLSLNDLMDYTDWERQKCMATTPRFLIPNLVPLGPKLEFPFSPLPAPTCAALTIADAPASPSTLPQLVRF